MKHKRHAKDEAALANGSVTLDDLKERNRIKRAIRNGEMPRMHFARDEHGRLLLPLQLKSTLAVLTKK